MEYILLAFIFFLGCALGSFLNVIVIRTHNDEDWITGRSKCPSCNKELKWFELLPVISFVIQKGKCRNCKKNLSIQYLLVEILVGSALTLVALQYNISFAFLNISIIVFCLIGIMLSDLRYKEIPMFLVYLMIIPGVFVMVLDSSYTTKLAGFTLGLVFYGGQYLLTAKKGIGDGDIYLGSVIGFIIGLKAMIVNIMFTYIIAIVFLMPLLIIGKLNRKSPVPLGAFICFSTIVGLLFPEVARVVWNNTFAYIPL